MGGGRGKKREGGGGGRAGPGVFGYEGHTQGGLRGVNSHR